MERKSRLPRTTGSAGREGMFLLLQHLQTATSQLASLLQRRKERLHLHPDMHSLALSVSATHLEAATRGSSLRAVLGIAIQ